MELGVQNPCPKAPQKYFEMYWPKKLASKQLNQENLDAGKNLFRQLNLLAYLHNARVKRYEHLHVFLYLLVFCVHSLTLTGHPEWLSGKESTCNAEDSGSIPGSGRSPGGGHGNHSSILAWRILDRRVWQATVHGVAKRHGWAMSTTHTLTDNIPILLITREIELW